MRYLRQPAERYLGIYLFFLKKVKCFFDILLFYFSRCRYYVNILQQTNKFPNKTKIIRISCQFLILI